MNEYLTHYNNTLHVSIDENQSISMEYAPPIPVEYIEPTPVCQCPDMGEANVTKIAQTAYQVLKCERELVTKMDAMIKDRRAAKD